MLNDRSNIIRIDPNLDKIFEDYNFTLVPKWQVNKLPVQRCSDDEYIPDDLILDHYRNLSHHMIDHVDYSNKIISGMVNFSHWLVTSFSESGVISPLNMYHDTYNPYDIHPGKKRYIVANYLGLDTVPVLVQQPKADPRVAGRPVYTVDQLIAVYGHHVSIKIHNGQKVECSWHGASNYRDQNGYDDWHSAAKTAINNDNQILNYLIGHGLHINASHQTSPMTTQHGTFKTYFNHNATDHDFYLEVEDPYWLEQDLWQLYFHFDPRVGVKTCVRTGIKIINTFGDPNWTMQVNLGKTLCRPWIPDPEKR